MTTTDEQRLELLREQERQIQEISERFRESQDRLHEALQLLDEGKRINAELIRDLGMIGEELLTEAVEREWCDIYGDFVNNLNRRTSQPWLKHCSNTWVLHFTVEVNVTGRTMDQALEQVSGMLTQIPEEHDDEDGWVVNSVMAIYQRSEEA